jgi:hypothetical protein
MEGAMRDRSGSEPFPRTIGVLLLLYLVIQLAVSAALFVEGMGLVAIIVLLLGPLVGLLVADAVLLYMRVTRSLQSVREALG